MESEEDEVKVATSDAVEQLRKLLEKENILRDELLQGRKPRQTDKSKKSNDNLSELQPSAPVGGKTDSGYGSQFNSKSLSQYSCDSMNLSTVKDDLESHKASNVQILDVADADFPEFDCAGFNAKSNQKTRDDSEGSETSTSEDETTDVRGKRPAVKVDHSTGILVGDKGRIQINIYNYNSPNINASAIESMLEEKIKDAPGVDVIVTVQIRSDPMLPVNVNIILKEETDLEDFKNKQALIEETVRESLVKVNFTRQL